MKEKSSFVVYYEWEEMFGYMTDKQIADMLRAMFSYAKRGELPEFSNPLLNSNFCIMKYAIDRDNSKYSAKCIKNKENAKMSHNLEQINIVAENYPELKSNENLQAKSWKTFVQKYNTKINVRTSLSDYRQEDWLTNIPLYSIGNIENILK